MAIRILTTTPVAGASRTSVVRHLRALRTELGLELLPGGAGRARLARLDRALVEVAGTFEPASALARDLTTLHDVLATHLDAVEISQFDQWSEERGHHLLERARQLVVAGLDHVLATLT